MKLPTSRPAEQIGDVLFSVQASRSHDSIPRQDGLPLEEYQAAEVALMPVRHSREPKHLLPSDLGIAGFDEFFEQVGPCCSAPWMPRERIAALRQALQQRAMEARK